MLQQDTSASYGDAAALVAGGWAPADGLYSTAAVSPQQEQAVLTAYLPMVKRVVAVGGDTVSCCQQGRLRVNGKVIEEPYLPAGAPAEDSDFQTVTVPEGRLFLLGDERHNSVDSTAHIADAAAGTVARGAVDARVDAVVWPMDGMLERPTGFETLGALSSPGPLRTVVALVIAGVVLIRQRPGKGNAIFITIEDETGVANLVVWPDIYEKHRRVILGSSMIAVQGCVQREGDVVHLVAAKLFDLSDRLGRIGEKDDAFPLPHGRGDEFHHGSSGSDAREGRGLRIKPRDFR